MMSLYYNIVPFINQHFIKKKKTQMSHFIFLYKKKQIITLIPKIAYLKHE